MKICGLPEMGTDTKEERVQMSDVRHEILDIRCEHELYVKLALTIYTCIGMTRENRYEGLKRKE